jgi:hypothetical protein
MLSLVVPRTFWDRAMDFGLRGGSRDLPASEDALLSSPLGIAWCGTDIRLLARRAPVPASLASLPEEPYLLLSFSADPGADLKRLLPRVNTGGPGWRALLVLGCRGARGQIAAWATSSDGDIVRVAVLSLPGKGMRRISLALAELEGDGATWRQNPSRWSRTTGALSEETWQRLTSLSFGVIGCGRLGSTIASSLAQMGVRKITLVDPDTIEPHNLGESEGLAETDLGRSKAEALALSLPMAFPWLTARPVALTASRWGSLAALKSCDLLFSCADTDGGRLTAGLLASLYLKVLVDVGTGVFRTADDGLVRGAEVRLILPGDGCLLCLGGVADPAAARAQLESAETEAAALSRQDWMRERAGSLRSLNQIAAGTALTLLERLAGEQQSRSVWLRILWEETAAPRVIATEDRALSPDCLCQRLGHGDDTAQANQERDQTMTGSSPASNG